MICAVSPSSITEMMTNQHVNSTANAFKFVLSSHFIEHINKIFKDDPARLDLFKQWLSYRSLFENRVRYIDEHEILRYFNINNDSEIYASCAYFAGHFIFDESTHSNQAYIDYGIDVSSVHNYHDYLGRGDNPIFEKTLAEGGIENPDSLCKFFKNETHVTFIDNYINDKSIDFIKHVIIGLRNNARVTVISKETSFNKSNAKIYHEINSVRSDINIDVFYFKNDKEFHDRHIFIGNRIHIRSTSGLDAFSFHGIWNNREGTFSVYDVHENTVIKKFDVKSKQGNVITIEVRQVKS